MLAQTIKGSANVEPRVGIEHYRPYPITQRSNGKGKDSLHGWRIGSGFRGSGDRPSIFDAF
jgi:hypothetical protein